MYKFKNPPSSAETPDLIHGMTFAEATFLVTQATGESSEWARYNLERNFRGTKEISFGKLGRFLRAYHDNR